MGRRILLPRADGPLAAEIRAAGAVVDAVPLTVTRTLPFALGGPHDWLLLTSPTAVGVLADAGVDLAGLAGDIAAVGQATAGAIRAAGADVSVVPSGRSDAAALIDALPPGPASALWPCSALAGPRLADGLRARGWAVDAVATYTTETVSRTPDGVASWDAYDAVVVTAGSIARAVVDLLGAPEGVRVVAVGAPSAAAARALGLQVAAVAATQDGPGVITALTEALSEENP
ncbi:uroporphyrinogen-III synthase [Propionicicella superfundia]|uniref:uroporphyrinogen-III synthase n=1 Tax=Propionicicella superfundia TaxID=348582 RepID=UPI001FE206BB|nr:uroporphyrinogen-III synthase [Propionicicella superfundia]